VHPQSWALWLAEALELPVTILGVDGATADDVLAEQVPKLRGPYDLAALHVGANDARALHFDERRFEEATDRILEAMADHADRLLVLTIPTDLGRPRAGADVITANTILEAHAASRGATLVSLEDLRGPAYMLPDAVHPTSAGMVEIADRAAAALGAPTRPSSLAHATPKTGATDRARYAAWYAKQVARDRRRRLVERWRYRHDLR
jgi:lysophospholipase L1-like esterase